MGSSGWTSIRALVDNFLLVCRQIYFRRGILRFGLCFFLWRSGGGLLFAHGTHQGHCTIIRVEDVQNPRTYEGHGDSLGQPRASTHEHVVVHLHLRNEIPGFLRVQTNRYLRINPFFLEFSPVLFPCRNSTLRSEFSDRRHRASCARLSPSTG